MNASRAAPAGSTPHAARSAARVAARRAAGVGQAGTRRRPTRPRRRPGAGRAAGWTVSGDAAGPPRGQRSWRTPWCPRRTDHVVQRDHRGRCTAAGLSAPAAGSSPAAIGDAQLGGPAEQHARPGHDLGPPGDHAREHLARRAVDRDHVAVAERRAADRDARRRRPRARPPRRPRGSPSRGRRPPRGSRSPPVAVRIPPLAAMPCTSSGEVSARTRITSRPASAAATASSGVSRDLAGHDAGRRAEAASRAAGVAAAPGRDAVGGSARSAATRRPPRARVSGNAGVLRHLDGHPERRLRASACRPGPGASRAGRARS